MIGTPAIGYANPEIQLDQPQPDLSSGPICIPMALHLASPRLRSDFFPHRLPGVSALLILALTGWVGCGPKSSTGASGQPAPPTVTVAPAEVAEVVEHEEFTGRFDAVESVEVRPRISGYIQEVRFQSGQLVRQGDVLFVIDPRWNQTAFDSTAAELSRAQSRLGNVEREAHRAEQLLLKNAISVEEVEARKSKLSEARAQELAAKAANENARLDLEYTQVKSPISGRVSRALITAGNFVSGTSGFNSLLTTVVSLDPIYVYADVDEASFLKISRLRRNGQLGSTNAPIPVEVGLGDETGFPIRGEVESFDNRVDANTGSIVVRVRVPNPDGRFLPGLFARLRVPTSASKPAVVIEEAAIGTDQSQKFVLTLTSSNTVAYRAIQLGTSVGGKRVVREGLKEGESVVVNGLVRVQPGMPVQPEKRTTVKR